MEEKPIIILTDYSNILKLTILCLLFTIPNAKSEEGFPDMKRVEDRSQLVEDPSIIIPNENCNLLRRAQLHQSCGSKLLYNSFNYFTTNH